MTPPSLTMFTQVRLKLLLNSLHIFWQCGQCRIEHRGGSEQISWSRLSEAELKGKDKGPDTGQFVL